jgi:hypothetical protein
LGHRANQTGDIAMNFMAPRPGLGCQGVRRTASTYQVTADTITAMVPAVVLWAVTCGGQDVF